MPARKRSKSSNKSKAKKKTPKPRTVNPTITIYADGTYSPTGGVKCNPGGVVKFDVTFPAGTNTCHLPFGPITFDQEGLPGVAGSGTIKVGS